MEKFFIDSHGNNDEEIDKDPTETDCDDKDGSETGVSDLADKLLDETENEKIKSTKERDISINDNYLVKCYKGLNKNRPFLKNVKKLMENSVINQGLEQCLSLPSEKTKRALKLERKNLRKKTKGKKWFDIPAMELTEEIKTDFELLKMRSVLEKKPTYKKNDMTRLPKYFQVGKVVESSADFYNGRIAKSLRKNTMVEELLGDVDFKKYQKKKFREIMDENRKKKRIKKFMKGKQNTKAKIKL